MEELFLFPEEGIGGEEEAEIGEERKVKPKMKITIIYHDGMRVYIDGRYYEVPLFDKYMDEDLWLDGIIEVVRKGPEFVEKIGREIPIRQMSKDIEWARRGSYIKILEELVDYYPEIRAYLHPKVQPRKL
jgi:hypothetical protein